MTGPGYSSFCPGRSCPLKGIRNCNAADCRCRPCACLECRGRATRAAHKTPGLRSMRQARELGETLFPR